MIRPRMPRTTARVLAAIAMFAFAAVTADAMPELIRPAPPASISSLAAKSLRARVATEPELIRSREVAADAAVLSLLAQEISAVQAPAQLRISFFDDAVWVVTLNKISAIGSSTVLTGVVPGMDRSAVTFVVNSGRVTGNVQVAERLYQLRFRESDGVFVHEAREIDPACFHDHDANYENFMRAEEARAAKPRAREGIESSSLETASDDGSIVDVLVAYTATTRVAAGGTASINAQIELAVSEANLAYQNSNITHRLRLVKTMEVDYAETGSSSTDLTRLRNRTDKFMDEIHAYRAAYGADVVTLIVERMDDACGIGYLMTNISTAFAVSAFNVVARGCATGNYTYAHEVGHNMGLRHDAFVDSGITPFPDAHGYVDLVARFRTVMAYNDACTAKGFSCRRPAYFSNPEVMFETAPTGQVDSANSARVLNLTRTTVANFVPSVNLALGSPVTFIKTSYSGTEGSSVVLTVERITGGTGPASVSYTTVQGTATAGADFTPASGTLNWASGDFSPKTITISLLQDSLVEASENFTVVLSSPVNAVLGTTIATVTVLDDEAGVFPVGCVMPAGWINNAGDSSAGWSVATDSAGEGRCSLKSGPIGDSGSDSLKISSRISVSGNYRAGTLHFLRRVSSENTFDCFRLTIDGVQQNVGGQCSEAGGQGASGDVPWGAVDIAVAAGRHTFTWSYEKDANTADGEDAVWIDEVRLPPEGALLTVAKSGNGSGKVTGPGGIDCGAACRQTFEPGTAVTLVATATGSDTFTGWTGACSGAGTCVVNMDASKLVTAQFSAPLGSKPLDYTDMWWAGQAENGWGMSITQHSPSNNQFNAFYVYEANRSPTWYVMPGGTWNANFTVFTGALYRPTAPPIPNYDVTKLVVGASVGTATLTFNSASNMTVSYTINGTSGSKTMTRQPFGTAANTQELRVGDMWWGGEAQNGWGVSILQQDNALFSVWYAYGLLNAPTWLVVPTGIWSGNSYTGTMYSTFGSPWLGANYNPATLTVSEVGTMTFTFVPNADGTSASSGTMTYRFTSGNFAGTVQTKNIMRQGF